MLAEAKADVSLSIVAEFSGQFEVNQIELGRFEECLHQTLAAEQSDLEIIVVFADDRWNTLPTARLLASAYANVRTLTAEEDGWMPGQLFNFGIAAAAGRHLLFVSARDPLDPHALRLLLTASRENVGKDEVLAVAGSEVTDRYGLPRHLLSENLHGWLLNCSLLSLSHVAIPADILATAGRFDESPLMQRAAEWDILRNLARAHTFTFLDADLRRSTVQSDVIAHYPAPVPVSDDIQRRYLSRRPGPSRDRQASLLRDIPKEDAAYLRRHISSLPDVDRLGGHPSTDSPSPLKITITGGPWEYHHNRLCFFNYIDNLEGAGFATYKSLFDHLATKDDIADSDIVILSRCKVNDVRQILRWCRDLRIPSIYMIDDNWLTVAADWPELYKSSFSPGTSNYDNFLFGVSNADYVLTYNRLLIADLSPYANQIVSIANSVDLAAFEATPRPTSDRFLVGYSGSARFTDAPFAALGEIGRARPDVDLLIFGTVLPHQRTLLEGCRIIELPHSPYEQYAREIRKTGVDILLGPLDDSRTSRSKCPNKYLEVTAAGAVGIYSDVEPYSWHVEQNVNGALVRDHNKREAWRHAIERLLNKDRLKALHAAARKDVAANFDVPVVATQFAALMRRIHAERKIFR
jgi:hypothetical protein